jgi:hypothetical protein
LFQQVKQHGFIHNHFFIVIIMATYNKKSEILAILANGVQKIRIFTDVFGKHTATTDLGFSINSNALKSALKEIDIIIDNGYLKLVEVMKLGQCMTNPESFDLVDVLIPQSQDITAYLKERQTLQPEMDFFVKEMQNKYYVWRKPKGEIKSTIETNKIDWDRMNKDFEKFYTLI